jgi:sulfur-oxidizing protein SoxZ
MSGPARLRLPRTARAGEIVEIRTLIEHPMETGLRRDASGKPIARDILARLLVRANGQQVFSADLRNGTSANPYHVFFLRIEQATELEFVWTHETGATFRATGRIDVT